MCAFHPAFEYWHSEQYKQCGCATHPTNRFFSSMPWPLPLSVSERTWHINNVKYQWSMLCRYWQIIHFASHCYVKQNPLSLAPFLYLVPSLSFGKTLSAINQRWSCVFLPVAFLYHDFIGALSSLCGWFPCRRLTLPLCVSSRPVILEEAKKRLHWKLHPCLPYNLTGPS